MNFLSRHLPLIAGLLALCWLLAGLFEHPKAEADGLNLARFAQIPILLNGRTKPLDTVGRSSLLMLSGKTQVGIVNAEKEKTYLSPERWLAEALFDGKQADERKIFLITDKDILGLCGWTLEKDGKLYSFAQLTPFLEEIGRQAQAAQKKRGQAKDSGEADNATLFERDVLRLNDGLTLYQQIKLSVRMPDSDDMRRELDAFRLVIDPGMTAMKNQEEGKPFDEEALGRLAFFGQRYLFLGNNAHFLAIPPAHEGDPVENWRKMGDSLIGSIRTGELHPMAEGWASLARAYAKKDAAGFNAATDRMLEWTGQNHPLMTKKAEREAIFNRYGPFYKAMTLYVLVLLVGVTSWLIWPDVLGRTAFWLMLAAFIVHTGGLIVRMELEGRPPVTNLYSSAVFIGWGAVALGLVLERIFRNGIGSATGGLIGFATLIIAHHLSLSGDTLEMMRAVLDSNFWLATHVVIITIGYSSTFLAGFLALIFILRGLLTPTLDFATARALGKMVYGIVCFALLFSTVGTILGGIWADQSWGRFWGWDPKENGALLIVLWNAIILHARWGGMARERGIMALAVLGNVVTAWSWFGVNMLGVGLHSYGFMDSAYQWLVAFAASQVIIAALAMLPPYAWRSKWWEKPRASAAPPVAPAPSEEKLETALMA